MSVHVIYYKDGAKMMRPILTREEYLALRGSMKQKAILKAVRGGDEKMKSRLVQFNYSLTTPQQPLTRPTDTLSPGGEGEVTNAVDGGFPLKGAKCVGNSVGMDIDHVAIEEMLPMKEHILAKKDELGLLMLEKSARGLGYHLVFKRKPELSQEENLRWASELLGVAFDDKAKDITRVFFTTSDSEDDLLFLDDAIFDTTPAKMPEEENVAESVAVLQFKNDL